MNEEEYESLRQQLQVEMAQKQTFQLQYNEVKRTMEEVEKSGDGDELFEMAGQILIKRKKGDILSSLKEKSDILEYSDSPFSAMQDLILKQALQNFGAFSALQTAVSSRVQLSPGEYLGPQPFYVFPSGSYTSGFFYLHAYNLTTLSDPSVMKELFQYDQNQGSVLGTTYGVFSPFLDIGGKYISASSMLQPTIFDNLTIGEVYSKIKSNTTISTAFNDSVDFLDAVLCSYTGGVQSVCKSNPVLRQASYIESQV